MNINISWWRIDFRWQLIDALELKWKIDLTNFKLSIQEISEQCNDFNPTTNIDSELYFEKLIKMAKGLRKEKVHWEKGHK